jgi:hypothetical protein
VKYPMGVGRQRSWQKGWERRGRVGVDLEVCDGSKKRRLSEVEEVDVKDGEEVERGGRVHQIERGRESYPRNESDGRLRF